MREQKRSATFPLLRAIGFDDDVMQMRKQSKRRSESKRRKRLKIRTPPIASLEMPIYNGANGIETTIVWKTEQHYQAIAIFLKKMLGERTERRASRGKRNSTVLIPNNK
jgi:hypothetical protein